MAKRQGIELFVLLVVLFASVTCDFLAGDEDDAAKFLNDINAGYVEQANMQQNLHWNYETDITVENTQAKIDGEVSFQNFQATERNASQVYDWQNFTNESIKREFQLLNLLGDAALEEDKLKQLDTLITGMETVYSTAKVCNNTDTCTIELYPDIIHVMATSENYEELKTMWKEWRDKTGKMMLSDYTRLVGLVNEAAASNGFADAGSAVNAHYLYDGYTEMDFKEDLEKLYDAVQPLYRELFTYVRRIMANHLYSDNVNRYGALPAHILGNLWAGSWGNVADRVRPFDVASIRATGGMVKKGVTADEIFTVSESFFTKLTLDPMTQTFNDKSVKTKPTDSVAVCEASAEDFYQDGDYRMKVCTAITHEDLVSVHQKMSQIQYFMGYSNQRWTLRNAPNPGFLEAVGGAVGLAVTTPDHLRKLGYIDQNPTAAVGSNETRFDGEDFPALPEGVSAEDLHYLLSQALDKIAFIPYAYAVNQWRWSVLNGTTTNMKFNSDWWAMRHRFQGLTSPVDRDDSKDFDAGSIYHIAADVEFVQYFVGSFLQFQLFESLCNEAGSPGPLYKCNFEGNAVVGDRMKALFANGSTHAWPDVLEELTGQRNMTASALLDYFKPLHHWLQEANANAKDCVGWEGPCAQPPEDNTVPIVVAVVLAVLVVLVVVAFFIGRRRSRTVEATASVSQQGIAE